MKTVKISDLFDASYGNKLDLNKMKPAKDGYRFIGRTAKNNGVVQVVEPITGIEPNQPGAITVALGGSILSSFVQIHPFYTAQNVAVLIAKDEMSIAEKLFYAKAISVNRFRYSTCGREANRTFRNMLVPAPSEIPKWVYDFDIDCYQGADKPAIDANITLNINEWKFFKYKDLFFIERGRGPRKKELNGKGKYPFVSASEFKNGITDYSDLEPYHKPGVITVARNGASVASAFYQEVAFHSTEDVHVFTPRFKMTKAIALFFCALIKRERYRYSYGRKWGIGRMNETDIKLPVNANDEPDWQFMEEYIKSLKFSSKI